MDKIIPGLKVLAVDIESLQHLTGNPRRGDVEAVARSLDRFGQRKAIVVREGTDEVLAGNHTLAAARKLGWDQIAAVYVTDDDATAKAYSLADNRTGDLGDYDQEALAQMIQEVLDEDPSFSDAMSYSSEDLDALLAELDDTPPAESESRARPATLTLNDRFMVGPFTVLNSRLQAWQDRKKMWVGLGIQSEIGRDGKPLTWNVASPTGHSHGATPLVAERSERKA